jgi:hypothetical protein
MPKTQIKPHANRSYANRFNGGLSTSILSLPNMADVRKRKQKSSIIFF